MAWNSSLSNQVFYRITTNIFLRNILFILHLQFLSEASSIRPLTRAMSFYSLNFYFLIIWSLDLTLPNVSSNLLSTTLSETLRYTSFESSFNFDFEATISFHVLAEFQFSKCHSRTVSFAALSPHSLCSLRSERGWPFIYSYHLNFGTSLFPMGFLCPGSSSDLYGSILLPTALICSPGFYSVPPGAIPFTSSGPHSVTQGFALLSKFLLRSIEYCWFPRALFWAQRLSNVSMGFTLFSRALDCFPRF